MYPYLTPFGVIMKINRTPLETVPTNNISQDHEFWSRYSDRLIGNWITYDTSVKDIAAFVDRVYIQHDFTGFKGDRKFIRDDEAQKAFSKLRSAIGGIYDWRFRHAHDGPDQMRMLKEADFAYRQSFAYCPYSPEAVFRYVNLLLTTGRIDDALTIAQICFKLDPNNANVEGLVRQLGELKSQHSTPAQPQANLQQLEKEVADNPTNFQAAFSLAADYIQAHQEQRALQILDQVLDNPKVDQNAVMFLAGAYVQMRNYPKLEAALSKLTQLEPHSPEAWCDLAAMRSVLGKTNQALQDLRRTLEANSARLSQDPKASNLLLNIRNDQRFAPLHPLPEYQQLVGGKT
jgi:thioredoxin-like negative regulator of GroEL